MSEAIDREQMITEIKTTLKIPSVPDKVRKLLEKELQHLLADRNDSSIRGTVDVSDDGRINGMVVGLNLGHIIFGRNPMEDERRRLVWYLTRLSSKLYRLSLRGLDEQLEQGKGLGLPQVYVMLSSQTLTFDQKPIGINEALKYFEYGHLKNKYRPENALPSDAISFFCPYGSRTKKLEDPIPPEIFYRNYNQIKNKIKQQKFVVMRQKSLVEQVRTCRRLILLGDPGSGKSTFSRHLAWILAQRGLDQLKDTFILESWDDKHLMLPIILPLRALAGELAQIDKNDTDRVVTASLLKELQRYDIGEVDDLLREALHRGKVLLFGDGLDEVPSEALPGVANRSTVASALEHFTSLYDKISVVVTCRTRAYDDQFFSSRWNRDNIAPFTLGQIRHFVPAWYREIAATEQINEEQASKLEQKLIDAILGNEKLQELARTPLLLTMMALVLYNKNELPRDRPQLYERILELLLGQWDKVRDGQSLSEAIGQSDWGSERIRPVLDLLSYQAHSLAASADGRGRLKRSAIRDALINFFEKAHLPEPWESAHRCLDYFEQRSGLVQPDEDETYVFAHLTLQEHCAGRHTMLRRDAAKLFMKSRNDDRWREPFFLGLGVIQQTKPELIDRILADLIDQDEAGCLKSDDRWQRDLILAAEVGEDRDWNYLRTQQVNVERLQRDLKQGLVELLQDQRQLLPATERIRAAFLLGHLGDPRFPVTAKEWQQAIERALKGDTSGYFCNVNLGTYIVGSLNDDPDATDAEKPQRTVTFDKPYLIARYPITNAQWLESQRNNLSKSYAPYSDFPQVLHPNQPICGIHLAEAENFCIWLSEQVGYTIRLPNEYEWEAAARGKDARIYPWGNVWKENLVPSTRNRSSFSGPYNSPVGCYPGGSSPCGALDMLGGVFELTAKNASIEEAWNSPPKVHLRGPREAERQTENEDDFSIIRGGHAMSIRGPFRCVTRSRAGFRIRTYEYGFRVMLPNPL